MKLYKHTAAMISDWKAAQAAKGTSEAEKTAGTAEDNTEAEAEAGSCQTQKHGGQMRKQKGSAEARATQIEKRIEG